MDVDGRVSCGGGRRAEAELSVGEGGVSYWCSIRESHSEVDIDICIDGNEREMEEERERKMRSNRALLSDRSKKEAFVLALKT
jgi:hypothetical protein